MTNFDDILIIKILILMLMFKISVYNFIRELIYDRNRTPYDKRGRVLFSEDLARMYKSMTIGQARYLQILLYLTGFVSVFMSAF